MPSYWCPQRFPCDWDATPITTDNSRELLQAFSLLSLGFCERLACCWAVGYQACSLGLWQLSVCCHKSGWFKTIFQCLCGQRRHRTEKCSGITLWKGKAGRSTCFRDENVPCEGPASIPMCSSLGRGQQELASPLCLLAGANARSWFAAALPDMRAAPLGRLHGSS